LRTRPSPLPYTTLFRSALALLARLRVVGAGRRRRGAAGAVAAVVLAALDDCHVAQAAEVALVLVHQRVQRRRDERAAGPARQGRSEEHTSELQSPDQLV